MRISDLLRMCVQNLRRRKFRTTLTVIGVVIGTTAIISMVSLGIGINKSTSDLISSWGDLSMIEVFPAYDGVTKLDDKALAEISRIENVDAITPFVRPYNEGIYEGNLVAGKKDRYSLDLWSIIGVYPEALDELGFHIGKGEQLKKSDGGKYINLVVGADVAYSFIDTKRGPRNNMKQPFDEAGNPQDPFFDPLNEIVTFKIPYGETGSNQKYLTYEARIVGILEGGQSDSHEVRSSVYMDVGDLQKIGADYKKQIKSSERNSSEYGQVRVKVGVLEDVSDIQKQIEGMNFQTYSMEGQRQDAMQETAQLQIILGGLGGVSLLVAAISIANTMVMSVYERTREIGVMKVLGCYVHDIRTIFLVEAAIIGFLGGLLGVALSYLISFILNSFGGALGNSMSSMGMFLDETSKISIIPPWLVLVGMAFATTIGILAGFYPAYRAVRISALEAIKQD